jgi:hypothetical protein
MRGRTNAALVALAVVDVLILLVGYRAHGGSLPPLQRTTPAFEVPEGATAGPPDGAADLGITAPLLLGVNPAGVVLRATRGACQDFLERPAQVWVGDVDSGSAPSLVEVPGVREVLGLMVYADGTLRITGLDDTCAALTLESKDGGASWQQSDEGGIWRLSADTTEAAVLGPGGLENRTPCAPNQILNLPRKRALGSCPGGTFFDLVPNQSVRGIPAGGFTQLSVAPGSATGRYYVLGATDDCGARVGLVRALDQSVSDLECFDDNRAPLAVASTSDLLVVQVGNDLLVSRDAGESFEALGS